MQRMTDEERRREREKRVKNARLFLRWWPVTFTVCLALVNFLFVLHYRDPDWQCVGLLLSSIGVFFWLYGWRSEARQTVADPHAKPRFAAGFMYAGFWMMLLGQMFGNALHHGSILPAILTGTLFILVGTVSVVGLREARREEQDQVR